MNKPTKKALTVDADGHVVEPATLWRDRVAPEFKDKVPWVETRDDSTEWWHNNGILSGWRATASSSMGGQVSGAECDRDPDRYLYSKSLPSVWDPIERLKVMDAEDIDASVLYPTWGLNWYPEPRLLEAFCQAYNDWLGEFCGANKRRLYGAGVIPLGDIEGGIRELRRCRERIGLKAAMLRQAPYLPGTKFFHAVYDPFWAEAQELACPIGFHPHAIDLMPGAMTLFDFIAPEDGQDKYRRPIEGFLKVPVAPPMDAMVTLASFVGGGILERFPSLKIAILEASGGWVPMILERLDHAYEVQRGPRTQHLKMKPSEYFKRNCWISFDPDEDMIGPVAEAIGADRILWASDFPHIDCYFPGTVATLRKHISGIPRAAQLLILGRSATEFYDLDL